MRPAPSAPVASSTRERLIQAATELITEGGYSAASVTAVAQRAGVAQGTMYRHFPSKSALSVEVFRRVCDRDLDAMRRAVDAQPCAGTKLEAAATTFASRALKLPRLAWALAAEPVDPAVDAERLDYRHTYRDLFAAIVRVGIENGEFEPQDADLTAALLVGGIAESLIGPLSPVESGGDVDPAAIDRLVELCRRAVGLPSRR